MKKVIFLILFFTFFKISKAQVSPAERTALQIFYDATNGPTWNSENDADPTNDWDFTGPVTSAWHGLTVAGGHVIAMDHNLTDDVAGSNNLSGILPDEIGDLQWLTSLDLAIGTITGPIPLSITTLTDLVNLNLFSNDFTGPIPDNIGDLVNLRYLHLSQNELTGEIPISITTIANLEWLRLRVNNLTGEIPIEITDMLPLTLLQLGSNQFTGFIYPEYGNLTNLIFFELESNLLTGTIPTELGNLVNVTDFRIGRQDLTGALPVSLRNLVNAELISIRDTFITGEIPPEYGELVSLEFLLLSGNELTGPIPDSFGNLTMLRWLILNENRLSGGLPETLSNLTQLMNLDLGFNQLSGGIPDSFSSLVNMVNFSVWDNQLTGTVPSGFSSFTDLQGFYIADNQLEGPIPDFSANPNFERFSFENNRYQFGDFEEQFRDYSSDLLYFVDNPQAKVNEIETLNHAAGENITLTITVSGAQNHYQWFKDGVAIAGAPDGPTLVITNAQTTDTGVYHCIITSDIVTDLTLVRNDITLTVGCNTPVADDPEDVVACENYTLPVLNPNNNYFTETNVGGTPLNAGDVISTTQTIYVYTGTSGCSDENSFVVTIDTPAQIDNLQDVEECEIFTLPVLTYGNYFSMASGQGTELFAGETITETRTVYIYFESGACSDESSFTVSINPILCDEEPNPDDSCTILFPNFFTPNSDGVNDFYLPKPNPCTKKGYVYIYDRYGKFLKQFDALGGHWDGSFNGIPMPSSDYWFRYESTENNEVITGHFSLKR